MSFPVVVSFYLASGFVMFAWMAHVDRLELRWVFWACLFWPMTLVLVVFALCFEGIRRTGWMVNFSWEQKRSAFGVRRPTSGKSGLAVRVLWVEIQVWSCSP